MTEAATGCRIDEDNVLDYCAYITGACSCEVKKQNPGIDLLTRLDWIGAMEGSEIVLDKLLPPMEGVALVLGQKEKSADVDLHEATGASVTEGSFIENLVDQAGKSPKEVASKVTWLIVIFGFVGVLLVGSLLSGRK